MLSGCSITIQSVSRPPQKPASSEAALRSLSAPQLARAWVESIRSGVGEKACLDEFNRRYWLEQEERASTGDVLRLYPPFRVISGGLITEPLGPEPFAS